MRTRTVSCAAALSAAALLLSACAAEPDPAAEESVDPYAAVSSAEETEPGVPESSAGERVPETAGPAALSREQIFQVLLDEGDLPEEPESFTENTGTQYFHESMGVNQGRYTEGFGESECAAAMDAVNVDLIGEAPLDGAIREASYEDDGASLVLWMLSYDQPAASGAVWDQLLEACEGSVLENGADSAEFSGFAHEGFSGMSMQMQLQGGSAVEGHFATVDHGHNLLMISALNLPEEAFLEVVEAQLQKLEAFEESPAG